MFDQWLWLAGEPERAPDGPQVKENRPYVPSYIAEVINVLYVDGLKYLQ